MMGVIQIFYIFIYISVTRVGSNCIQLHWCRFCVEFEKLRTINFDYSAQAIKQVCGRRTTERSTYGGRRKANELARGYLL